MMFLHSNTEPESDKTTTLAQLHDLLLQLFVMLSNECGKVSNSVSYSHNTHTIVCSTATVTYLTYGDCLDVLSG